MWESKFMRSMRCKTHWSLRHQVTNFAPLSEYCIGMGKISWNYVDIIFSLTWQKLLAVGRFNKNFFLTTKNNFWIISTRDFVVCIYPTFLLRAGCDTRSISSSDNFKICITLLTKNVMATITCYKQTALTNQLWVD